jgi:hypothetical protein
VHDMVVTGVGETPMTCLLGERRSSPPSLSEAMWNFLVESPVMAYSGDDGPPWVEPMVVTLELLLQGERLRPLKQSTMNSRIPKRMVLLREKPSCEKHSLSAAIVIADERTRKN